MCAYLSENVSNTTVAVEVTPCDNVKWRWQCDSIQWQCDDRIDDGNATINNATTACHRMPHSPKDTMPIHILVSFPVH